MVNFLGSLFEQKSSEEGATSHAIAASTTGKTLGYGMKGPWDTDKAIKDAYEKVIWVYRCTDACATALSSIPIVLRDGDKRSGEIIPNDTFHRLFNLRANKYESAQAFRYRIITLALLSRKGVFIEVPGGIRNAKSMHILPPTLTEPIPDEKKFVSGYRVQKAGGGFDILKPHEVIWIRIKPDPMDPYAQMTPLVAAGIAVETDWLARMYNRNFLMNDGRPGLLVTVKGNISREDAEELKRRFSGTGWGGNSAGRTTVIEGDGLDVGDMSASPRDVQWQEAIAGSKQDIMLAFGTPESVLGNASGRTFDNADAEREGWWKDTLVPIGDALSQGFDVLTGSMQDERRLVHDYSTVDVLQRQELERQRKIIAEFKDGTISWNEMRKGLGKEPSPSLAADIQIGPGGFAFHISDESKNAQIMQLPNINEIGAGEAGMPGAGRSGPLGLPPGHPGGGAPDSRANARAGALEGSRIGARRFNNIIAARTLQLTARARELSQKIDARRKEMETKDEDIVDAEIVNPYEEERKEYEAKIEGVLIGFDSRQEDVISSRVMHTKVRQGTRHWQPGEGKTAKVVRTLDPNYVVETDRWVADMRKDFDTMLKPVVAREAARAARDMKAEGILDRMIEKAVVSGQGSNTLDKVFGDNRRERDQVVETTIDEVLSIVDRAVRGQSDRVVDKVRDMDEDGASAKQIQDEVRTMIGSRSKWRRDLSKALTTCAIESIREKVYMQGGTRIRKTWNTAHDERVRASHSAVDGKSRYVGTHFTVGGAKMMRPGDPSGPAQEVVRCRCWLTYGY